MTKADVNSLLVAVVFLIDLVLLLGIGYIARTLGPVKRLTLVRETLWDAKLDVPLGPNEFLGVMCNRLLYDLLLPRRRPPLKRFLGFPVGRLLAILYTGDEAVVKIVRELQAYAFLMAILFIVGIILRIQELEPLSIAALWQDIGANPLHVLDQLALAAIGLFLLRLVSELSRLNDLLKT